MEETPKERYLRRKKERTRECYNKRKEAGLCTACGKEPARQGRVTCEKCARQLREYGTESYKFYKDRGICVRCRKAKAEQGRVFCKACGEYTRMYQRHMRKKSVSGSTVLSETELLKQKGE